MRAAVEAAAVASRLDCSVSSRVSSVVFALQLSYFTIGWNGAIGAASLAASFVSGSSALAGFALTALLDSAASIVVAVRFGPSDAIPHAQTNLRSGQNAG